MTVCFNKPNDWQVERGEVGYVLFVEIAVGSGYDALKVEFVVACSLDGRSKICAATSFALESFGVASEFFRFGWTCVDLDEVKARLGEITDVANF